MAQEEKKKKSNIAVRVKEAFGELKNVTFPSFNKVVKDTGVVLLVVLIFAVLIYGIDSGFSALWKLLVNIK